MIKLEDKAERIIQNLAWRIKNWKQNSDEHIEDRMMTSNTYLIIEVLEGEKELGRNNIRRQWLKFFQNCWRISMHRYKNFNKISSRINKRKSTSSHIKVKLSPRKDREKNLKSSQRKKTQCFVTFKGITGSQWTFQQH